MGILQRIQEMASMFSKLGGTRKFNRGEAKNGKLSKTSSSNFLRGKRLGSSGPKGLTAAHFGTFSPVKKINW